MDCTRADHERLLAVLRGLRCMVMVSGYRSDIYDAALRGWHRREIDNFTQVGSVVESVWLNYEPGPLLPDYGHVGADFREREAIRRRVAAVVRRIAQAPDLERNAMLAGIGAGFPGHPRGVQADRPSEG